MGGGGGCGGAGVGGGFIAGSLSSPHCGRM